LNGKEKMFAIEGNNLADRVLNQTFSLTDVAPLNKQRKSGELENFLILNFELVLMSEFPTNVTQGRAYQVVSSLPGRMRLRIPSRLKDSTYQNTLRGLVAAIEGVTSVRINPLANSMLVTFAEGKISSLQLEEELATAIAQAAIPHKTESKTATIPKRGESKDERITVTEAVDKLLRDRPSQPAPFQQTEALPANSWQRQCQEQAESIEQLQDRLAALRPVAAIGSAWLRRWHLHSPGTLDSSASAGSSAPVWFGENQKTEAQWQELAGQQIQAISNLEQCLADLQRLAVIGEARLNKYRKYL
jgi:hypothetical protein